jgi:hypothetical protein
MKLRIYHPRLARPVETLARQVARQQRRYLTRWALTLPPERPLIVSGRKFQEAPPRTLIVYTRTLREALDRLTPADRARVTKSKDAGYLRSDGSVHTDDHAVLIEDRAPARETR